MYEPDAVINQPLVCVNDVSWERDVGEFVVEDSIVCARVGVDEAVRVELRFDLNLVVVASCFKLKHAEGVVAVHSVREVPEDERSGDGFDICRQLPDNVSQFDG